MKHLSFTIVGLMSTENELQEYKNVAKVSIVRLRIIELSQDSKHRNRGVFKEIK